MSPQHFTQVEDSGARLSRLGRQGSDADRRDMVISRNSDSCPLRRAALGRLQPIATDSNQEQSFRICHPLSRRSLPAPSLLVRIILSYSDKVQLKTPFLNPKIKTRPSHFVLLCEAPEVHLKETPLQKQMEPTMSESPTVKTPS